MLDTLLPWGHYLLFVVGIIATITDFWRRKIYNWLTLPAMLFGLVLNGVQFGWVGLGDAFLGLLLGGFIFFVLGMMGMMGGGDVKLAAAVGALIGWKLTISALYYATILGGIFAIVWSLVHGTLWATLQRLKRAITALFVPGMKVQYELNESETEPMPYGVAISWGAIAAAFQFLPPVIAP